MEEEIEVGKTVKAKRFVLEVVKYLRQLAAETYEVKKSEFFTYSRLSYSCR